MVAMSVIRGNNLEQRYGTILQRKGDNCRQRSSAASMGREINTRCIFAERLLEDYLFGHIQAVHVQAYAALVEDMDIKNDLLHTLAEFGSRGKHANNVNQQLKDFIKTYVPAPKASEMQLRMQITKGEDRGEQTLPHFWMPIHVWLWWLYSYAYQAFLDRMVGPAGALLDFWSKVDPADPRLEQISSVPGAPWNISKISVF